MRCSFLLTAQLLSIHQYIILLGKNYSRKSMRPYHISLTDSYGLTSQWHFPHLSEHIKRSSEHIKKILKGPGFFFQHVWQLIIDFPLLTPKSALYINLEQVKFPYVKDTQILCGMKLIWAVLANRCSTSIGNTMAYFTSCTFEMESS